MSYAGRRYDNTSLYESSQNGGELVQNPNDGLFYNQNIIGGRNSKWIQTKIKGVQQHHQHFTWTTSASYNFEKTDWFNNTRLSASYSASPTATMAQAVEYGYYHSLGIAFSTDIPKIKTGLSVRVDNILHGHEFVESTIRSGTFIRHSSKG